MHQTEVDLYFRNLSNRRGHLMFHVLIITMMYMKYNTCIVIGTHFGNFQIIVFILVWTFQGGSLVEKYGYNRRCEGTKQ